MMITFPVFRSLSPLAAGIPVVMPSSILLLTAATSMVMTNPQRIPAWCFAGAVFIAIFTIYQAREKGHKAARCVMVGLASLFFGVALPRPVLYHLGISNLEYWTPEFFMLCGAAAGLVGWTLTTTGYNLVTNNLPSVIGEVWGRFFGSAGQKKRDEDTE